MHGLNKTTIQFQNENKNLVQIENAIKEVENERNQVDVKAQHTAFN